MRMPLSQSSGYRGQLARFVVSGTGATLVDLAILNILLVAFPGTTAILGIGNYFFFKTISFTCAATFSYFANKHFTFRATERSTAKEVFRFTAVTLVGFCINVILPTTLFGAFGSIGFLLPFLRANAASIVGTMASLVVNFFGYKFFVFGK